MIDTARRLGSPLQHEALTSWLAALRQHAFAPCSQFAVAVVLEVQRDNDYFYFAGVNVESQQLNRLSMHAEQTAVNAMVACLGPEAVIRRAFFMGAPQSTSPNDESMMVWPCGHCRQILQEFSNHETLFQPINLKFECAKPRHLTDLLSAQFGQQNLGTQQTPAGKKTLNLPLVTTSEQAFETLLKRQQPYILSPNFQTNSYQQVLLETVDQFLVPGVLVQNAAFLTTDPIMGAVANAVCHFGDTLVIKRLHLLHSQPPQPVNPAELSFAKQFGSDIELCHYLG